MNCSLRYWVRICAVRMLHSLSMLIFCLLHWLPVSLVLVSLCKFTRFAPSESEITSLLVVRPIYCCFRKAELCLCLLSSRGVQMKCSGVEWQGWHPGHPFLVSKPVALKKLPESKLSWGFGVARHCGEKWFIGMHTTISLVNFLPPLRECLEN